MKFLLTQEELDQIKEESNKEGYKEAERLLEQILNGHRDLYVGRGRDKFGMNLRPDSLYDSVYKSNVWRRLLERLDGQQ